MLFNTLALALPALSLAAAAKHQALHGKHSATIRSQKAELEARLIEEGNHASFDLEKRQASNARFTFYEFVFSFLLFFPLLFVSVRFLSILLTLHTFLLLSLFFSGTTVLGLLLFLFFSILSFVVTETSPFLLNT